MTLLVGFSPDKGDKSALHLGATLARSAGEELRVVVVVPAPWPTPVARGADREYEAWARDHGDRSVATVTELLAEYCPDVSATVVAVPGKSEAATLIDQAEQAGASMIVIGSGSDGSWGTIVISSTADRLLHSSPVPVAIAPRGSRAGPGATVTRVTCAFRGDESSRHVLVRTATICREIKAGLRVVTFGVRGRTMYPAEVLGETDILDAYVQATSAAQAAAVASLGDEAPASVETGVATGRSWAEALEDLHWEKTDLLVVGSSSSSLLQRLFLGSNAIKIVRHSPVPVVIVP
jgi:nucleotide-binding universal stress UspA family protein